MSEPGSWPSGPYQQADQSPPYWAPSPPGPPPGPYANPGFPVRQDRSAAPPTGALVAVGVALGLSMLVGLSRWLGAYVNTTSGAQFREWPYRTGPVVVEILLAAAGFVTAVAVVSRPARRSASTWSTLAAAAGVLGYALNDGLYQVLTLAL